MKKIGKLLCHDGTNTIHNSYKEPFEIAIYLKNNKTFYRFENLKGEPLETDHYIQIELQEDYHQIKHCL